MEQDVRSDQAATEGRGREAWQHLKAAGEEIRRSVASMVPPECRAHSRAAGREALLAARSVLDAAIEQLGERPSPQ
jgi:hypothetical protein